MRAPCYRLWGMSLLLASCLAACGAPLGRGAAPEAEGEEAAAFPVLSEEQASALAGRGARSYTTAARSPAGAEGSIAIVRRRAPRRMLPDARLDAAARRMLEREQEGRSASLSHLQELLWWKGVPHADPALGLFGGASGEAAAQSAVEWLEEVPPDRGGVFGLAAIEIEEGTRLAVVRALGGMEIGDVPRGVEVGERLVVEAVIDSEAERVSWAATTPRGGIVSGRARREGEKWLAEIEIDSAGRWQIELLLHGSRGPRVALNFPVWAGREPRFRAPVDDGELESRDPRELERLLFEALNESRAAHDLPPVERSSELDEVCRRYSEEMAGTGVVAHVSPRSGGPADRARAAGLSFPLLSENLARAHSAAAAQRGLLSSPAHRANILDPGAVEAGVGVALSEAADGEIALLVTELIVSRPEQVVPEESAAELSERIRELRERSGLKALERDPTLDAVAERLLEGCFGGETPRKLGLARAGYESVIAFEAEAAAVERVLEGPAPPELKLPEMTHFGVAVSQGTHPELGAGIVCVRAVFGAR
jgi:hypothetical protein